jgi:hypothetical protein
LYVCVSCPVYIFERLILCVSENICIKFAWLLYTGQDTQSCKLYTDVLTDTQYKTYDNIYRTRYSNIQNICIKFVWLCVLSCIYCRTSYIVCQWEHLYKVCMFEYLVLYILSLRRTTIYTGQDTQSCKLYTDVLTDTQYKTYDNIYRTRHTIMQTLYSV